MEIAMFVFGLILLNVFFMAVNDKALCLKPDNSFQAFLFWFFSVPMFIYICVVLFGQIIGKMLRSLDKFASK